MLHRIQAWSGGIALSVLLMSSPAFASTDEPAAEGKAKPAAVAEKAQKAPATKTEKAVTKKELNPEMVALRDRVRQTVAAMAQQAFNTQENNVSDLIDFCLAYGCDVLIHEGGPAGEKINGITCLCWDIPCAGYLPLMVYEGHLAPRVGYGYQATPSQFAAMLALSHVPASYPARVGERIRSVADVMEYEKSSCRAGADPSLKLIALSYYVQSPTWKNSLGEEWSIERLVKEELAQLPSESADGLALRLLAVQCALQQRTELKKPIDGDFLRAQKWLNQSRDYLLRTQGSEGSWGGNGRDNIAPLLCTGQTLEWLVTSLPEKQLEDPQIVRGIEYLTGQLSDARYRWNVHLLGSQEIGAIMHAVRALRLYDQRVFAPADSSAAPAAATAQVKKTQKLARKPSDW